MGWTPDHRDRHAADRHTPMPESAAHIGYDADRADLPTRERPRLGSVV